MPQGRPIEYREEHTEKAKEYLASCIDYPEDKETGVKAKVNLPTIEGLADYLDIHKDTIYEWESRFPNFSDVITKLRNRQANKLVNNGLAGTYNPTIAKVLLTKHGYREGQDVTTNEKEVQGVVLLPKKDENTLDTTTQTNSSSL
jgi:hypothetical protein